MALSPSMRGPNSGLPHISYASAGLAEFPLTGPSPESHTGVRKLPQITFTPSSRTLPDSIPAPGLGLAFH